MNQASPAITRARQPATLASPANRRDRGASSPALRQANAITRIHDAGSETSKPSTGVSA